MSDGMDCTCAAYSESECCCGADWTPQEVIDLRRQLAEREKQIVELQKNLAAIVNQGELSAADLDEYQLYVEVPLKAIKVARKTLNAITQDLSGLILCDAEPVGWMDKIDADDVKSHMVTYAYIRANEIHSDIPLYQARSIK